MELDDLLVFHCAPTLAGLKGASLICVSFKDQAEQNRVINSYNERYNDRGLYFKVISACKGKSLLYVYRPSRIANYLFSEECRHFLSAYGYRIDNLDNLIITLVERFKKMEEFPHELGVFLEYPLEDVKAFIQHKGHNAKLCGEWKVYSNTSFAEQEFSKYRVCRKCYVDMFNRGFTFERLIIA